MAEKTTRKTDVESFNDNILHFDLDDVEVGPMEHRIELALASIFDGDLYEEAPGGPDCGTFSCNSYFPAA